LTTPLKCSWSGVFPAATTQFGTDLALDLRPPAQCSRPWCATAFTAWCCWAPWGKNNSLSAEEKRAVLKAAVGAVGGKLPLIAGVSELTTANAAAYARDAERIGVNGLMVLPAMVYVPTRAELEYHLRTVRRRPRPRHALQQSAGLSGRIEIESLERLAELANVVALKESSPDPRRFTDVFNALGDRYVLFAGLDDFAFEALALGARGWVSGLTNVFPVESLRCMKPSAAGSWSAPAGSIAGSCRSCTWTPSPIWCSPSSSRRPSWDGLRARASTTAAARRRAPCRRDGAGRTRSHRAPEG